jgi:heme A synthase
MPTAHRIVGFTIVGGFVALFLWGGVAFLVRRHPTRWFWRLLAVLQVALIVQLGAGLTLLALGYPLPGLLHLAYGAVFPAVVLAVAHVLGRSLEDPEEAWKVFTVGAFFIAGLTLRALATGLGLP